MIMKQDLKDWNKANHAYSSSMCFMSVHSGLSNNTEKNGCIFAANCITRF